MLEDVACIPAGNGPRLVLLIQEKQPLIGGNQNPTGLGLEVFNYLHFVDGVHFAVDLHGDPFDRDRAGASTEAVQTVGRGD
jgi:hypothetical protein